MDIAPPNQHPATSDDELAKVLAGIGADDPTSHQAAQPGTPNADAAGLQFEETPPPAAAGNANVNLAGPSPAPIAPAAPTMPEPASQAPMPSTLPPSAPALAPAGGLDELKKTALEELRPLVGKLDLPPEDKFDTLLLIIRSTDDQSLLAPAHEAARAIPDENKRAQALLDVIKEIDYFSQGQQPAA